MSASLCAYCRRIDFNALRGPTSSQVDVLLTSNDQRRILSSNTTDEESRIVLGTLRRIRDDAPACRLCAIFCHIIDRQGASCTSERNLDSSDICFVATAGGVTSYFGTITETKANRTTGFILQRLTLTAHEELGDSKYGDLISYLTHVLQGQIPGSFNPPARGTLFQPKEVPGTMLFGARKRPLLMNIALIKSWVDICSDQHWSACADIGDNHVANYRVRFIDVKQRSVKTFTDIPLDKFRYVALSYVWGPMEHQTLQLKKCNVHELGVDGSLELIRLPRTIQDAVDLAQLLDFRFLWVDALCIIQDDVDDQKIQISNMHGIYKSAFVTIVAASGEHSDVGLPGLRSGTRAYKQREVVVIEPTEYDPGLSLVTTLKSNPRQLIPSYTVGHDDVDMSVWNRRAWTMQEKALSRRTITFSSEQVTWDCRCASYCEEAFFEIQGLRYRPINTTSYHDLAISGLTLTTAPWDLYRRMVDQYSQRNLSYPGDYSDAFQAVVDMISPTTGTQFLWGLPCSRFDLALSWDTVHGVYRRIALSKLAMTSLDKRVMFPSWSWLGWVGHAHCSVGDDRMESETSTISCYVYRSAPPRILPVHTLLITIGQTTNRHEPRDTDSPVSLHDINSKLPLLTSEFLSGFADDYLLFFWAYSAQFTVKIPNPSSLVTERFILNARQLNSKSTVYDASGQHVGDVGAMAAEYWSSNHEGFDTTKEDFIAIGRREIRELPEYPVTILAMQIKWTEGIAYRINVAEIGEAAWEAAGPKRILVVLG